MLLFGVVLVLTSGYWSRALGRGLVYRGRIEASQAILIENFAPDYLLFERTAQLLRDGWAKAVFVPAQAGRDGAKPGEVPEGIIEVMARVARISQFEIIPVKEIEPISLNVAYQVRDYLSRKHVRSIIVLASGFCSRRSHLIWKSVLGRSGIKVSCVPVFGLTTPDNWLKTWHGRQEVILQALKLAYYDLFVLSTIQKDKGRVSSPISTHIGVATETLAESHGDRRVAGQAFRQ